MAVQKDAMRKLFPHIQKSQVLSGLLKNEVANVDAVNSKGESALDAIAQQAEIEIVDGLNAVLLIDGGIDAKHKLSATETVRGRDGVYAEDLERIIGGETEAYLMFRRVYDERDIDEKRDWKEWR